MTRTLAALVVALAVLVTACTDEPQPRRADATTPPPTSEPTETTPPPTPPSPDPEPLSPEDTVRAWVEAFNTLAVTGEEQAFVALSTTKCSECNDLATSITAVYERGGSARTRGWLIAAIDRAPDFATSRIVAAGIDASRTVTIDQAGAEPRITPPDKFIVDFTVRRTDSGRWAVQALEILI